MEGFELLNRCFAARTRYENEIDLLKEQFIISNTNVRIGNIVEFKNMIKSGVMIVDDIWLKLSAHENFDEIKSPNNFIHQIYFDGRLKMPNGNFSSLSSRIRATDVMRIIQK